jgi:hypothetical protein
MNPRPHRPAPPTDKGLYVAYALTSAIGERAIVDAAITRR